MKIHERLGCFGYYGFGSGWEMVRRIRRKKHINIEGEVIYCDICPLQQKCWERHRERVAELYPILFQIEEMMPEGDPTEATLFWLKSTGQIPEDATTLSEGEYMAPVTLTVQFGNLIDGQLVAQNKQPEDRLDCSLTWPLEPLK